MRNVKSFGFLVSAVLLIACGSEGAGGTGTTLQLKTCNAGQVLSTDASGQFVCKDLPAGAVSLPACDPNTGGVTADGKALSCTDRNVTDSNVTDVTNRLNTIRNTITDLTNRTTVVQNKGGTAAVFVGTSKATTNGMITDANGNIGVAAAANVCVAEFGAGARLCSVYDIYNSIVSGKITPQQTVLESWVYLEAWTQVTGATELANGLNENCAGFTYKTADQKWTGTVFKWEPVAYNGKYAPKFTSGLACGSIRPIACCK